MLFVTVSVLQLREVVHPELLSLVFRPQEWDLLGSLLQESGRTHARRMAMSLVSPGNAKPSGRLSCGFLLRLVLVVSERERGRRRSYKSVATTKRPVAVVCTTQVNERLSRHVMSCHVMP